MPPTQNARLAITQKPSSSRLQKKPNFQRFTVESQVVKTGFSFVFYSSILQSRTQIAYIFSIRAYIFSVWSTYTFSVLWQAHILYSCIHILQSNCKHILYSTCIRILYANVTHFLYSNCIYILYSFFKFMHSLFELHTHSLILYSFIFLHRFSLVSSRIDYIFSIRIANTFSIPRASIISNWITLYFAIRLPSLFEPHIFLVALCPVLSWPLVPRFHVVLCVLRVSLL